MKKLLKYVVAFFVLAVAAHLATVYFFPNVLMGLAENRLLQKTGGEYNTLYHGGINNISNQVVVMTCPDLLYSFCNYDLDKTALRLRMPMVDSYWSVAMYANDTTNYFTASDRDFGGKPLDLLLVGPGWSGTPPDGARVVKAPAPKGLIMLRTLVVERDNPEKYQAIQKLVSLEPFTS